MSDGEQDTHAKAKLSDFPWSQIAADMRQGWRYLWWRTSSAFRALALRVLPEKWQSAVLSPEPAAAPQQQGEDAGDAPVPTPQGWAISEQEREELYYARDAEAALRDAPSQRAFGFVTIMFTLVFLLIGWAYFADLEEVTRGEGRVIPSSKAQLIQSLEGGIVEALLVREGEKVSKDQVLLRIDDTGFSSDLGELNAKELSLRAQIARLKFESGEEGSRADTIEFPKKLAERAPQIVENEKGLFQIRKSSLANQQNVLEERLEQRNQELARLRADETGFARSLDIATQRHDRFAQAEQKGALSVTRVLEVEQQKADLSRQLEATRKSIAGAESAVKEAKRMLQEQVLSFRQTAHTELNTKLAELAIVEQSLTAATDRVNRADIRSPVDGIVNKLHVNTIGGVVRAGESMVEITPMEDNLFVEVRVQPKDIAFIRPGLPALVKVSAYDFTIYGGLDGKVEVISSDSIVDDASKESYYLVTVKTDQSSLRKGNESLPIIPGMVATVDIITGEKSVLEYLLKPIVKAQQEALRER